MPRNVRPIWITVKKDGKKSYASGPQSLQGTMEIDIKMRSQGTVKSSLLIKTHPGENEGTYTINIFSQVTEELLYTHTERL